MRNSGQKLKLFMILALSFVMVIAGCSSSANTENNTASNGSGANNATSTPTTPTPEAAKEEPKEPITLKVWIKVEGEQLKHYNNLAEAPVAQELMKRTGVKLEFIHPPVGQEPEQFNIMVAANDLPDVVMGYFDGYKGGFTQAVADGLLIDPAPMLEEHAPNLMKLLADDPDMGRLMKNDAGQFIGFGARVNNDVPRGQGMLYAGPLIRKDLLDQTGLGIPETVDEWYTVLKAIKDKFPELEAPFGWSEMTRSDNFLASAYGVPTRGFYVDLATDEIKMAENQPVYKDYLTTLNKWYADGLLHKDFATHKYTASVNPMMQSGSFAAASMHLYWYGVIEPDLPEHFEFAAAKLPVLEKGQKTNFLPESGWSILMANVKYITTKNKYPEETIKFFDYLYSDEGKLLTNWGIEGESYQIVNGQPEFTEEYTADIARMGYLYTPNVLKQRVDQRMNLIQYSLPVQHEAWDVWGSQRDPKLALLPPGISFTTEEQAENTKIMTDVNTYVDEMYFKFIMGVEPLDKFDEFVQKIESFGIDNVLANHNAAYQRLKNR